MRGLQNDLLKVAGEDILGRKLQDAGILTEKRAPKFKKAINRLGVFVDIKKPYGSLLGIDWLF